MKTGLAGKVVLVTGASGGIGSAIARQFAAEDARLVLHYNRSKARAIALAADLGRKDTLLARADLSVESDVKRMFHQATKRFGRVDTLIANAGWWETRDVPMHRMTLKQWRATMDGVLTTAFLCLREFMRLAAQQKRGNAVVIASTAAVFGEAGHADYAAGKAALAYGLVRSLKNEFSRLAPHTRNYCGGRINCICPGWTIVPRNQAKLGNKAMVRRVTSTMALPQIGRPDDMAGMAVYLSSDLLARHITGQTIVIAGGMEGRLLWAPEEIDPGAA
jgi:3-oxoacyl-[acyl-carrier protein] reductase